MTILTISLWVSTGLIFIILGISSLISGWCKIRRCPHCLYDCSHCPHKDEMRKRRYNEMLLNLQTIEEIVLEDKEE
jgi:hypothetical protein